MVYSGWKEDLRYISLVSYLYIILFLSLRSWIFYVVQSRCQLVFVIGKCLFPS